MATYYVDDGGNNSDGSSWANAYTSVSALDDAVTLAEADVVYIGHDHVCQYTHSASRDIAAGGATFISVTQGSNPPTYQKSSTDQIDTSEGAYSLWLNGGGAWYGVRMKAGASFHAAAQTGSGVRFFDCTFAPGANGIVEFPNSTTAAAVFYDCTFDLTADGSTTRASTIFDNTYSARRIEMYGATFVNAGYRTGSVFNCATQNLVVSGCDFSGFTNANCELIQGNDTLVPATFSNCLIPSGMVLRAGTWRKGSLSAQEFYNCASADDPAALTYANSEGTVVSSTAVYRSGGAAVEGVNTAWLVTTNASAKESRPFYTPWIYGVVSSTGSKTFDLYITNDTADFTDAEAWPEVDYLSTEDEAIWARATGQRATITTTAAAQTDDTTSTWNGAGPSFTYKQKLSVTATVGEAGQFRARVAVGVASIASSRYFYVDPKVTVS